MTAAAAMAAAALGSDAASGPVGGLRSAMALLDVLAQTFSALGLGYTCVRFGFVDVQRGDLQAVQFFIGRIALPILVFRIIATGDIKDVDIGVIIACSLGKMAVYALTFIMTFCAYKNREPIGQKLLTATIFGFFTTASNDLAIGYPVVKALYGESMDVYLTTNVLVFQTLIQPLAIVLFEVGQALSRNAPARGRARSESGMTRTPSSGHLRSSSLRTMVSATKAITLNPILIATISGAIYALAFGYTLTRDDEGRLHLPSPLDGIVTLWTSPFTMMFLFLNGTALRSASIALWPAVLVLMKVVVCSYISYALSYVFVDPDKHNSQVLKDFTFFYGTIPSGGAPLIYAQLFNCGVDVVASASLFGVVLAGPIEFVTALFLGTLTGPVNPQELQAIQLGTARASTLCSAVFVAFLILGWWGGSFSSRAVGVYGVIVLLYSAWSISIMTEQLCHWDLAMFLFRFLQNVCIFMVVYLEYHLGTRWQEGRRARSKVVGVVVISMAVIPALIVTYPNSFHIMCAKKPTDAQSYMLLAWNITLSAMIVGLAVRGVLMKQRHQAASEGLSQPFVAERGERGPSDYSIEEGSSPRGARALQGSKGVATTLVVLQFVRLLMQVIDTLAVDIQRRIRFEPMLILEIILEHGQGCFLLLATILQPTILANMQRIIVQLWDCGFNAVSHPLPELAAPGLPAESQAEWPLSPSPSSMSLDDPSEPRSFWGRLLSNADSV
mmetsp:Transcript_11960/g.26699  ORF Transcript_11960/g.26699 Transcript_11960/m.26699 type:complete len:726 (+) Transcript_11960:68-2245(+)